MPKPRMMLFFFALLVIPPSRSWAGPPREGYVPVEGGLRLHYREIGQGKDAVIIPSDVGWGTRADGLAVGRTVVLYDPRGHGRSDEVKDPSLVGMDYEVRDIEALRRQLSLDRVSLIGWSYKGALVALYAAQYPERVGAVVQVGPMPLRKGEESGHLPFAEQPTESTRAVETFLKGAWPPGAETGR